MLLVRRLGVLLALLVVGGAWSGSALAAAPVNKTLPTIDGRPQVGATMAAFPGTWDSPAVFTYQWQHCDASGCADIAGATGQTYVVRPVDGGATLEVGVVATNGLGEASGVTASAPTFEIETYAVGSAHFLVHYTSDPTGPAITQTMAGDVAALAARAYAAELADEYPAPMSDGALGGDARTDLYVVDLSGTGALGITVSDAGTPQTPGYIFLDGMNPDQSLVEHVVAHEFFHLIQIGIWFPASLSDYWLLEGSADWMGYRVDGYPADSLDLGDWDMALDCRDPNDLGVMCDLTDSYRNNGYSRWPFFEYLGERWGAAFVKDIFTQGAAGAGSATAAVSSAVAAKGTTLADVFTAWSVANMTGAYTVPALQGILPPSYGEPISAGTIASLNVKTKVGAPVVTSGPIASRSVAVNHLSTRYVAIERGDFNSPDGPCYAATLSLKVGLPAGVGATPYYWWSQKNPDATNMQAAQALSISGNTATISVPWDTCDWGLTYGYLMLPNPTTNLDAQDFTVTGTISIDRATEATATPPPDPVVMPGTIIDASSASGAPLIQVFGPELIHLSATSTALRLIVSSSDTGALRATLGSLALGSVNLRPGSNDVRFTLPKAAFSALRRTSAATSVLTLTPVSASGVAGISVVRHVAIAKPEATKSPAKLKPKHPAKKKSVAKHAGSHR